ncbi:MAG: hypothetical protein ACPLKP_02760 [Microgenomates group bacterium]
MLLTILKEGYLLLANTYGFLVHPYLTLKKISQDRSQGLIFLSLWLGGWLAVGIFLVLGKLIVWFFPDFWWVKKFFWLIALGGGFFLLVFSLYLGYWLVIFWRKK